MFPKNLFPRHFQGRKKPQIQKISVKKSLSDESGNERDTAYSTKEPTPNSPDLTSHFSVIHLRFCQKRSIIFNLSIKKNHYLSNNQNQYGTKKKMKQSFWFDYAYASFLFEAPNYVVIAQCIVSTA